MQESRCLEAHLKGKLLGYFSKVKDVEEKDNKLTFSVGNNLFTFTKNDKGLWTASFTSWQFDSYRVVGARTAKAHIEKSLDTNTISKKDVTKNIEEGDYVTENKYGYYLNQAENNISGESARFIYSVYDSSDIKVATWKSNLNALAMPLSIFKTSLVNKMFEKEAESNRTKGTKNLSTSTVKINPYTKVDYTKTKSSKSYLWDDDDYDFSFMKKSTGFLDKLNKSDTLVIHCADRSTEMLSQVYDGKNWDVLTDGNIDKNELHQLIESHDKIVMLGHGSPHGLFNKQGSGFVIGDEEAEFLKDKKLFAIWCYADKFFDRHNIGNGCFITKNTPSEKWESQAAGCGNISAELMLENITYWSKLCSDIVDKCLSGSVSSGVDYLRKHYLENYGNHPVTIFNADSAHALGEDKPLPKYTFIGKKLTEEDYPIPNFNEEAFLLNPTEKAKECPTEKE